jgi:hypothetical protein
VGCHGDRDLLREARIQPLSLAVQVFLLAAGEHHLGSVLGETLGDGRSKASTGPGHYCDTPGKAKVRHCR